MAFQGAQWSFKHRKNRVAKPPASGKNAGKQRGK
jgi:hypothetical protein